MRNRKPANAREHFGMPFDVAVACGYVPDRPVGKWRARWNRFRFWLWPSRPLRAKIKTETVPDSYDIDLDALSGVGPSRLREWVPADCTKIHKAMTELDHVLNQTPGDAAKFWREYDQSHPHLYRKPETADDRGFGVSIGAILGLLKVWWRGSKSGGICYSISREDADARRYWTGRVSNQFVPEGSPIAIWETTDEDVAKKWLDWMMDGQRGEGPEETTKANEDTNPVPELRNAGTSQPDQVKW